MAPFFLRGAELTFETAVCLHATREPGGYHYDALWECAQTKCQGEYLYTSAGFGTCCTPSEHELLGCELDKDWDEADAAVAVTTAIGAAVAAGLLAALHA